MFVLREGIGQTGQKEKGVKEKFLHDRGKNLSKGRDSSLRYLSFRHLGHSLSDEFRKRRFFKNWSAAGKFNNDAKTSRAVCVLSKISTFRPSLNDF
jgi:hypothetical protein